MKAQIDRPSLSIDRDGYQVITVVNVGPTLAVVWSLIHRTKSGYIDQVAKGWRWSFEKAQSDAYDAFMRHSSFTRAKAKAND